MTAAPSSAAAFTCDGAAIGGATGTAYVTTPTDAGRFVDAFDTVEKADGSLVTVRSTAVLIGLASSVTSQTFDFTAPDFTPISTLYPAINQVPAGANTGFEVRSNHAFAAANDGTYPALAWVDAGSTDFSFQVDIGQEFNFPNPMWDYDPASGNYLFLGNLAEGGNYTFINKMVDGVATSILAGPATGAGIRGDRWLISRVGTTVTVSVNGNVFKTFDQAVTGFVPTSRCGLYHYQNASTFDHLVLSATTATLLASTALIDTAGHINVGGSYEAVAPSSIEMRAFDQYGVLVLDWAVAAGAIGNGTYSVTSAGKVPPALRGGNTRVEVRASNDPTVMRGIELPLPVIDIGYNVSGGNYYTPMVMLTDWAPYCNIRNNNGSGIVYIPTRNISGTWSLTPNAGVAWTGTSGDTASTITANGGNSFTFTEPTGDGVRGLTYTGTLTGLRVTSLMIASEIYPPFVTAMVNSGRSAPASRRGSSLRSMVRSARRCPASTWNGSSNPALMI